MSDLEIFGIFVVGLLQGAWLGWYARERYAMYVVSKIMNEMQSAVQEVQSSAVPITVYEQSGQFFVHNTESGEFLAQGTNHEEITKKLNERYPGKLFTAEVDNLKSVGYKHDAL